MSIASIASCACTRVCASTTATASPTKRTVSTASACRGGDASGLPSGRLKSAEFGSGLTPALTKSCPVTTPVTPGIVSAAALLANFMQPLRRNREPEQLFLERQHRARQHPVDKVIRCQRKIGRLHAELQCEVERGRGFAAA